MPSISDLHVTRVMKVKMRSRVDKLRDWVDTNDYEKEALESIHAQLLIKDAPISMNQKVFVDQLYKRMQKELKTFSFK